MAARRVDGKKRPPDRMPKLLAALREQVAALPVDRVRVIGGKSMGGRVASLLAAEAAHELQIAGVVCLGFPFHRPGKPDNYRAEHLAAIATPTLILQGQRDPFGSEAELVGYPLADSVCCRFLNDGEHSFKPRQRSGVTLEQNLACAVTATIDFIRSLE